VRTLVTGGTGFLGAAVVQRLVDAGHAVRLVCRNAPNSTTGLECLRGDLREPDLVRAALKDIEVVYHLAGLVSFDPDDARAMYELHVECTRRLLEQASEAGVQRIVLASTSGTIAVARDEKVGTEADDYPITVVGRWPYYLSKIYQEKLALDFCRAHSLPLVVLNPGLLLGPGDDRLSSTWVVSKFLNQDIPAMPSGGLSFVDVRDVADAFVQALGRGEVGGRHLMGVNMSFQEFFGRLARLTGVGAPKLRLTPRLNVLGSQLLERWAKLRGVDPPIGPHAVEIGEHFFYLDSSKAERELGFRARDPHETLHDTVQYLLRGRLSKQPDCDRPSSLYRDSHQRS
jgi:dihydroflavonol-4-reductase